MARSGASRSAAAVLQRLVEEGHGDEETLGLLARTCKDVAFEAVDERERRSALDRALAHYLAAYERSSGYWTGVNAATLALLLSRHDEASALARDVRTRCLELASDPARGDRYWVLATLGEAALVLGQWAEAEDWYRRAVAQGRGRVADLVSTRRNARRILRAAGRDAAPFDACFAVPKVVVFAGHLVDRPGRATPRFPPALEPPVRDAIRAKLASIGSAIGYASAASGGDILFLECLADAAAETHVVLPYNADRFRLDSVAIVPDGDWSARFDRVLARATDVQVASDHPIGSGALSFEYGFRLLDGTACIKADELETDLVCLALWDGLTGDGPGGTASAVEHWRRAGRSIEIVSLSAAPAGTRKATTIRQEPAGTAPALEPEIVGLLFADVRGFSQLVEEEIPLFIEHCLGTIANQIDRAGSRPQLVNTWGDGLYIVFADVGATGEFALALSDTMRRIDWRARGFGSDLALRIGLHAGPAYACLDPVTKRRNYIGAHVSRAARIEPIAPPGEVYASGAFAALARAAEVASFRCAYVGQTPLAKGYGTFPTYVLRPR